MRPPTLLSNPTPIAYRRVPADDERTSPREDRRNSSNIANRVVNARLWILLLGFMCSLALGVLIGQRSAGPESNVANVLNCMFNDSRLSRVRSL